MDRGPVFAGNYRRSVDDVKHKTTRLMFVECGHRRRPGRITESIPERSRRLWPVFDQLSQGTGCPAVETVHTVRDENPGQPSLEKAENSQFACG